MSCPPVNYSKCNLGAEPKRTYWWHHMWNSCCFLGWVFFGHQPEVNKWSLPGKDVNPHQLYLQALNNVSETSFLNYLLSHVCNQVFYYSKRNRICMKGIASAFTSEEKRVYCDPYWGNRVGNQLLELPLWTRPDYGREVIFNFGSCINHVLWWRQPILMGVWFVNVS